MEGKYTVFQTKMGWVGVAAKDKGIFASTLPQDTEKNAEAILLERLTFQPCLSPTELENYAEQIKEYFLGKRDKFSIEIDWGWATPFQKKILQVVEDIPYGSFITYGEAAALAGYPGYSRAAGSALKRNNIPIIIPCHRVIKKQGQLGGFTGAGIEVKAELLKLEGLNIIHEASGNSFRVC